MAGLYSRDGGQNRALPWQVGVGGKAADCGLMKTWTTEALRP